MEFDTLVILYDMEKEEVLKAFSAIDGRMPQIILYGTRNYEFDDPCFQGILESLPVKPKAHGYPLMLTHIYQSLLYITDNAVPGDVAEFGTFQGGTTVFMAKVLEMLGNNKKIYTFDTFAGYPPRRSTLDLFSETTCEFKDVDFVQTYCKNYDIELVRGDIVDNIHVLEGKSFAFSFFDTDNYSPTKAALELVYENIPRGGILAFDHYYSENWIKTVGERMAAREVLGDKNVFHLQGTGIFMKCEEKCGNS
ncbi:MAG: class I SAM-dependent methyltransferase [Theionarchaea archaeon]|nr:class I SAM-dependent methyltransferase [Theionarchaea archaeon]